MAIKGIFRRAVERITTPVKKFAATVSDAVSAPFAKKPPPRKPATRKPPPPRPAPPLRPAPRPYTIRSADADARARRQRILRAKRRQIELRKKRENLIAEKKIAARPSPAVAREQLAAKFQDMFWLQKKWDAAATNKRINRMTDDQVYAALDLSENEIDTAVRANPREHSEWASPDDPNSNILWYHGGEASIV